MGAQSEENPRWQCPAVASPILVTPLPHLSGHRSPAQKDCPMAEWATTKSRRQLSLGAAWGVMPSRTGHQGGPWQSPGILQGQRGRVPSAVSPGLWGLWGPLLIIPPLQERQRKYLSLSPWDKATLSMVRPLPCAHLGEA